MCNFSGMIKNVLPSLRQRAGPQRICSRQKSIRSGTARDSFSQTPHMRGKDVELFALFVHHGITPACAGKRWIMMKPGWRCRDHPRTCGEKYGSLVCCTAHVGSPPHMRGKGCRYFLATSAARITPAHAGKRLPVFSGYIRSQDHPRTCGEKAQRARGLNLILGSPPHMRGKGPLHLLRCRVKGITPAHAGKSRPITWATSWHRDHPRTCGEKMQFNSGIVVNKGSPPHMRGKVTRWPFSMAVTGITPAHAGKSYPWSWQSPPCQDHPRTCGEKGACQPLRLLDGGITPAHAGKRPRISARCASR